jgi:hypothetical protein
MGVVLSSDGQSALTPSAKAAQADARSGSSALRRFMPLGLLLSGFWIYVAASNVLYARSMAVSLDPDGSRHLFAAWDARVLQHLFLYPILLACVWLSQRIGWRAGWRALYRSVPLQLALAALFAISAMPLLGIGELVTGAAHASEKPHAWLLVLFNPHDPSDRSLWVASATSFLLTYGFALALVSGFALYRQIRDSQLRIEALERASRGARLAALRMQLSPHTLFNLLHTIRGQIAWDPALAQSMVVQLGDLLRRLLAAGESHFTRLTDELQFARLYLELQQRRFSDRLQLQLPDAATLPSVWVPSLILQPLIENAVVHGLADHTGPVLIELTAATLDGQLRVCVQNSRAAVHPVQREGIGLRNVRERLAVQFGLEASLLAGPTGTSGWQAEVRLPLLNEPPPPLMPEG